MILFPQSGGITPEFHTCLITLVSHWVQLAWTPLALSISAMIPHRPGVLPLHSSMDFRQARFTTGLIFISQTFRKIWAGTGRWFSNCSKCSFHLGFGRFVTDEVAVFIKDGRNFPRASSSERSEICKKHLSLGHWQARFLPALLSSPPSLAYPVWRTSCIVYSSPCTCPCHGWVL